VCFLLKCNENELVKKELNSPGLKGTDELERRDYGFEWMGSKGLHPDQYSPDG